MTDTMFIMLMIMITGVSLIFMLRMMIKVLADGINYLKELINKRTYELSENIHRELNQMWIELDRRLPSSQYPLKFEECSYDDYKPTNFEDIKDRLDDSIKLDEANITLEVIKKDEDLIRTIPLPIIHSDFEFELEED